MASFKPADLDLQVFVEKDKSGFSRTRVYLLLYVLILYVPVNNFSVMRWDGSSLG